MIGFSYIYRSQEDIFNSIVHISEMTLGDIVAVISCVGITLLLALCIIPSLLIILQDQREEKNKKNKKKLLSQILMQKEIEDEVEKEIQIEDESTVTGEQTR